MKIKDFICETNWTQGVLARDKDDNEIKEWPYAPSACKWCLTGMIILLYAGTTRQSSIVHKVRQHLEPDEKKQPSAISRWNDSPGRTWMDVRDLATTLDI